jgi:uncharacterized protein
VEDRVKVAYLDIETDYVGKHSPPQLFKDFKNHLITVLGVRVMDSDNDSLFQFVGQDITRANLLDALAGVQKLVTYNGRSKPDKLKGTVGFDFPVIHAHLGVQLDAEYDHLDLVPECWKKNLYGGLKKVEQALGLKRQLPGKDGLWAMQTYREYVKSGDKMLLDEVLLYNKEDVFMLREIERKLAGL